MTRISIGDMAQNYMLRSHNARLKGDMTQLVQELASGRSADLARHLSGSYSYLADVERNLTLLDGYGAAASEARVLTNSMQNALENFQTVASDLGLVAMSAVAAHLPAAVATVSARAEGDFAQLVAALNASIGGRSLFSGTDVGNPPIAAASTILDELRIAVSGQTSLTGVQAALDSWFDAPLGGFETLGYIGGADALAPLSVRQGETLTLDLKADDQALRDLLKPAAMVALASDSSLGFSTPLQEEMMQAAAEALTFNQTGLTQIRANLGYAQQRVEEAQTRISSERTGFQIARTDILAIDPYETATDLENTQYQLESLYSLTVRLSRMSLLEYL